MALDPGDVGATHGLAQRIFNCFTANAAACGFGAFPAPAQDMMKAFAYCVAQAVVDEIQANGAAVVKADTTGDGLQQSGGVDTTRPTTDRLLRLQ